MFDRKGVFWFLGLTFGLTWLLDLTVSAFSVGISVFGITTMTIIALLILRDPIWRGKGINLIQPASVPVDMALSGNPRAVEKSANQSTFGTIS
jgi:hypothetical protein